MRLLRLPAAVALILAFHSAALADGSTQLDPDGSLRYEPVFVDESGTTTVADIDSLTSPAISPDGSEIAFSGSLGDESLALYALFVVGVDGSGLEQVTDGTYGEFDPVWSPDGAFLTFSQNQTGSLSLSACCRLARVEIATGAITALTGAVGAIRPALSPDGALLSYDNPTGLWTMPSGGGSPVLRVLNGYDSSFSPDGESLVYVINVNGLRRLRTVDIDSGVVRTLFSTSGQIESPKWRGGRIYFVHHTGSGYDGRSDVELRSITTSGTALRVESSYADQRVGFDVFDNNEILFYRSSNGDFSYFDIAPDAALGSAMASGSYSVGWDSITAIDLHGDGHDEVFFYRPTDGVFKYYETEADGSLGPALADGTYSLGWDSITAVDVDGDSHDEVMFYRSADGVFKYYETKPTGALGALLSSGNYSLGWDSITRVDLNSDGRDELLFYRSSDGVFKYYETKANGSLGTLLSSGTYSLGWDSITKVDLNGDGLDEMLFFRASDGTFKYYETKPTGALGTLVSSGTYRSGWDLVTAIQLDDLG